MPPTPAFWRASTDNDRGCGFPQHASAWMAADVFLRKEGCTVLEKSEQRVQICYKYSVPLVPGAGVEITHSRAPGRLAGGCRLPWCARRAGAALASA